MFYIVSDIHGEKNRMYLAWNPYLGYHWVERKEINGSKKYNTEDHKFIFNSRYEAEKEVKLFTYGKGWNLHIAEEVKLA